jgi:osmotically-inducible protein OsmY
VSSGWVKLEGEVDWGFQREAAERSVRHLLGVLGVSNLITVKPHVAPTEVKSQIESAFKRAAEIDARHVDVQVTDGTVKLFGTVHSWKEKEAAEHAAWAAPGVRQVENQIVVTP